MSPQPRRIAFGWWTTAIAAASPLISGCDGVLAPAGSRSGPVADLWWFMLILGGAVSVLVAAMLLAAVVVARRRNRILDAGGRGLLGLILGGGVAAPFVVALALTTWGLMVDRTVLAAGEDDLVIEVTGHRWWWEVHYPDYEFTTANEIYIPVGRAVRIQLTSVDVIHSFWVPALGGKADLVPGRTNQVFIEADHAGRYRGQCAEYCGIQHAQMRVFVVALAPEQFDEWAEAQRAPAADPEDEEAFELGRETFLTAGCAGCHSVRGHEGAVGSGGPDLTHLQSRETIAAGTLPNTRDDLEKWIRDPQGPKPGALMPTLGLSREELDALLAYLEALE